MIKWFLIGCLIVVGIIAPVWIWTSLSDKAQWVVLFIISFVVLATFFGLVAFAFFGGTR